MGVEDEYKRSTRWLGPLFVLALLVLVALVWCGGMPGLEAAAR